MIVSIMHQEMRIWRKIVLSAILWLSMLAISCQGTDCGNIPRSNANGNFSILAEPWGRKKVAYRGQSILFNCTTNNKDATVFLQYYDVGEWLDIMTPTWYFPKGSVNQTGYIFVLKSMDSQEQATHYRCIAKLLQRQICLAVGSLSYFDNPNAIPIYINPTYRPITGIEGAFLTFNCFANGFSSYLKWYKRTAGVDTELSSSLIKEEDYFNNRQPFGRSIVIIKKAKKSDGGTYVCARILTNTIRKEETVAVLIEAPTRPVIKIEPSTREMKIQEKVKTMIKCSYVSGQPKPTMKWTNSKGTVLNECHHTSPTCTLILANPIFEKDHGRYTCTASSLGGIYSQSISVNVLVPVELDKEWKMEVATFTQTPELTCRVKRANPLPVITWLYQPWSCSSETCTPHDHQWLSKFPKISLKPDANVATNESKLVVPASKVAAFYSCQASNQVLKELKKDFLNITLHRVEKATKGFRLSAVKKSINENDTFLLNCSAAANIFNKIKWMKEGKYFMEKTPRIKITNIDAKNYLRVSVITFERVELNDAGTYTCIGFERRGGIEKAKHNLTVLELKRPKITGLKDLVLNQSNQHAVIFCNAAGNPMPSLSWKFRGGIINEKMIINKLKDCQTRTPGFYYIAESHKSKLVICNLNYKKFQGEYKCEAKNKVGSDESKFNVIIHAKPIILKWDDQVPFEPGKTARLFCEAEGNPPPNVTIWKMKRTNKIALKNIQRYGNGTAYVILKTNKDTKGQYACTAENSFGVTEKSTTLSEAGFSTRIQQKPVSTSIIATIVVCSVLFIIILIASGYWYKRKLEKKYAPYLKPNRYFQMDPDRSLFEQSSELPYDPDWEFPREKLTFVKMIGSGAFGEVWLGEAEGILTLEPRDKTSSASKRRSKIRRSQRYTNMQGKDRKKSLIPEALAEKTLVAVKTLKGDASDTEYKDLASELKILIHIGENKQIVNLLGACTRGGKLCVVLEYCPNGSLLNFLRERRDIFEPIWYKNAADMGNELTHIDLTMVAYQIAKGMDFLASKKCVHRDLAARNVLLGVDYIVKIADFGLARDIYKDEFYMKSTSGLLPVKWMAPESLFDKIYTSQSDVWSYGIVLWEIFTLGGSPYPGLPTEDLFSFLEQGRRMDQSELCPLEIYAVMRDCWERNPNDRPLFSQVADRIGQILSNRSGQENPYLQFDREDGMARAKDSDYLVPVMKEKKVPSDEYLDPKPNGDRSPTASYLNEDHFRMSLMRQSDSDNYANMRHYSGENEAIV